MLWQKIQQKVNAYNETLETFSDMDTFQEYWYKRAMSVPSKTEEGEVRKEGIKWAAV